MLALAVFAVLSCSPVEPVLDVADPRAKSVLVVYNSAAPESKAIADRYLKARGVPSANLLAVKVTTSENIAKSEYKTGIVEPVKKKIAALKERVDFILMIRGMPLRLDHEYGHSVDASLMADAHPKRAPMDWWAGPTRDGDNVRIAPHEIEPYINPYGGSTDPFNSDKSSMYLVTRLDAYSVAETLRLIESSISATATGGTFLLDSSPERTAGGYGAVQKWMQPAQDLLEKKQIRVVHEKTKLFVGDYSNVMGYASWGSNDPAFAPSVYHSIKFAPGAIAETFVSTSGRTFRKTSGGQSLVADLITQGATGVKGYVSEPYTFALCRVDVLFGNYIAGRNLAESFWSATPLIKWKDVVIGDPLCAPYAK